MDSPISLLQQWYARQCDEDWEHSYGVKIETLDNPGWILTVDLIDTGLSAALIPMTRNDRSDQDWVQFEVVGGRYIACGGAFNLEEMIIQFLIFAQESGAELLVLPEMRPGML